MQGFTQQSQMQIKGEDAQDITVKLARIYLEEQ